MRSLTDISKLLAKQKNELFAAYSIESMAIFGSWARNEQNDSSDLDILVEFSDKIGIEFIDLADELEEILNLKVDLVSRKGIKEKYLESIDNDLIYV